ncbi:MAG: hypothetical protein O2865_15135 [Planctomycetota bacterium]|nr:hypothetical protein [Planctomycetota bacterium]MDA0932803.1 hypothetical protein [Planctomycetota bacterium]
MSVALMALVALPASCSTLPDARWPVAIEGEVEVLYRFGGAAPRLFRVPSSDETLTVLWLEAAPVGAVQERFVRGERIWIAAEGQDELRVRCGYRWTGADRPTWEQQFPGGTVIADHDR